MNVLLKIAPLTLGASLLLSSCFSTNPRILSTPAENVDNIPLKTTILTDTQLKHWNQSDLLLDTIPGMSVDRAYEELLKHRRGKTVVVAVVDSGIDINHEDLKGNIWKNPNERLNGKDDDNNGYIDDIHGWNFLGDIVAENMEFVRIIRDNRSRFENVNPQTLSVKDKELYNMYTAAKAEYDKEIKENTQKLQQYEPILQQVTQAHNFATKRLGKPTYTSKELLGLEAQSEQEQAFKQMLMQMYGNVAEGETMVNFVEGFDEYVSSLKNRQATHYNFDLNARKKLNDNIKSLSDKYYGNNKVGGPDPKLKDAKHGTHVAGIIAANRNNKIGAKGIAKNVKIMAIRAVPDGDEYDKDIALAIRYAVDNGAKVINTSFGKYFSTNPEWVREAIIYAASKDVLIVNAAGNDAKDMDKINVYPNDQTLTIPEISDNFLTVGALNYEYGSQLVASFSNYGKTNVDVFAPGVKIYSTTPLNTYEFLQGTSMAAPSVAGVAAVIRSYFPNLKAAQVKKVIMDSGNYTKARVILGDQAGVPFEKSSKSGKMVNLYNAILLAQKLN